MTDTGQVPGEGLPENAGMVEQPGAPAHGAYTYLSETTAEDEDLLLLPGAQGAWGNEVAPPAPEPVVETVHEPGPHEMSGRDSGSVDLSGVRLPNTAPPSTPAPPRRPLHLGPPIPDTSASPVRSLADRGAVGAPVRQSGPATTGPEYFDVPQQLREMPPQGATPWGATPVQVPVSPEATAAETVVPAPAQEPEPVGAAQAAVTHLATEAVTATAPQVAAQYPEAGPAAQALGDGFGAGVAEGQGGVAAQASEDLGGAFAQVPAGQGGAFAQGPAGQGGAFAQGPDGWGGEQAPDSQGAGFAQAPDAQSDAVAQAPEGQDGGFAQVPPVQDAAGPGTLTAESQEGGYAVEAPPVGEAAVPGGEALAGGDAPQGPVETQASEAGQVPETVQAPDATQVPEAVQPLVAAPVPEAVQPLVAAPVPEAVQPLDAAPVPVAVPAPDEGHALGAVQDEIVAAAETEQADGVAAAEAGPGEGIAPAAEAVQERGTDATADAGQVPAADPAPVTAEPVVAVAPAEDAVPQPETAHTAGTDPASETAPVAKEAVPGMPPVSEAAPGLPPVSEADTPGIIPPVPEPIAPEIAPGAEADTPQPAGTHPGTPGADAVMDAAQIPESAAQDAVQPAETPATEHAQTATEAVLLPAAAAVADAAQAPQPADDSTATAPVEEVFSAALPSEQPPLADAQGPQLVPDASLGQEAATDAAAQLPEAQPQFATPDPTAVDPTALAPEPPADQPVGQFVQVEGSVPTTPHLAPTPPHAMTLPPEDPQAPQPVAAVPTPREGDPELVQHAEDLDTRAADQEDQQDRQHQEETSTAPVGDVRQSTGPAAPAYDDAEREAVLKVMRERRDIRNGFRSDPIPHEVLLRVLEAAHTAPSVGHSQPWDFVVIRSAETRSSMHELAMRQRDAYAKSLPKGRAKQFKELKIEAILDTPVNIVVTADPTRGGRHTLGRHTQPQMAPYSAALAVENLWLAARAEGLGVGWVSFFDEREMVRSLGLPEHLEVIAYLCVGYVDEFPDEPELMQAGWSKRRPLSWVVHEETYGRRALPGEEPHDLLGETVAQIRPLDAKALGEAWERQKRMTKPPGSLGMLEIISAQLSGLSRQCPPPIPEPAAVAIFAGDHGVHAQGVTPWPQEVTAQMVANFLGGGAVCNAFASQVGAEVCVVDVGVASELPATPGLLPRKIRAGTSDMTTGPAMTREEAKQAIEVGIDTARDLVAAGNKALLTGEMGIANTTASAALISVFTGADPAEVTGRGTGINDETLARKTEVVRRALELHQPDPADPIGVLAAIGGFEHAAIVGLLLGGASLRTPVILDGVSAGAAALVARAIAPEVLAACIAGHRSAEPGHVAALNKLGLRPLVDLDLRLGEGTGALLALPLVQSTARAMHEVATFDSAGVTEK